MASHLLSVRFCARFVVSVKTPRAVSQRCEKFSENLGFSPSTRTGTLTEEVAADRPVC